METRLQRRKYLSRNWAAMDTDILCSIFTRLSYVDLLRVNSTCWGWNAAIDVFKSCSPASTFQEIPWLIFTPPEKDEVVAVGEKNGLFMNVEGKKLYPFNDLGVKKMKGGFYCIGSSRDWLVCLEKQAILYLLHPFTSNRIELPRFDLSLGVDRICGTCNACAIFTLPSKDRKINCVLRNDFVSKAALSSSPSLDNKYYYLVVIYGAARSLAFCKDGDTSWTKLDGEHYHDIIFHENQLYGFYSRDYNHLIVWDMNQDGFNLVKKIDIMNEELKYGLQDHDISLAQFYLVESQGSLLVVRKFSKKKGFPDMKMKSITGKHDSTYSSWTRNKNCGERQSL